METTYQGHNVAYEFKDVLSPSIATADYSQDEVADESKVPYDVNAQDRGFMMRPGGTTQIDIRAITHKAWLDNEKFLTIAAGGIANLVPITLIAWGGVWEMVRLIKVYAADDGTYPSTGATTINIGVL